MPVLRGCGSRRRRAHHQCDATLACVGLQRSGGMVARLNEKTRHAATLRALMRGFAGGASGSDEVTNNIGWLFYHSNR